jgi:ABC-2 type transport system ATP-binding protein
MLSKDSGEVLWDGKELDVINTKIGYLAEERGLYPKYTLMDQLMYFARLKRIPKKLAKERIDYWAKRLEVEEYLYPKKNASNKKKKVKDMTADQLSKGNQQKIQMMCGI